MGSNPTEGTNKQSIMIDSAREAADREVYINLPADVSINYCVKSSPMNIDGSKAAELKQLWIHDDAEETEESKELDSSTMFLVCPHCRHSYSVYIGD